MDSGPSSAPSAGNSDRRDDPIGFGVDSLLTAADIAGFRVRADGTIDAVNDAFTALTGYSRAELVERDIATLLETDAPSITDLVADAETTPVSTSLSLRTRAETVLSVDVHLETIATGDADAQAQAEEAPRIVGLVDRQPSAPATAEASSLTYGQTFQALADALPDGIIVLDSNSDIQYANPAIERILGYAPSELVGSSKLNIIPPRLRQTHLDAIQQYLETGNRSIDWTYVELPGKHKDGHEVPLGVSLNDFHYDDDRYFVGLFRDITPRKEVEQSLTARVSQLESVAYLGRYALENPDSDDLFETATDLITAALEVECCLVAENVQSSGPELGPIPGPDSRREPEAGPESPIDDAFRIRSAVGCDDPLRAFETKRPTDEDPHSLTGATLATDDPVVVEDVERDSRFPPADGQTLSDHGVHSGAGVTIGPLDDPWGALTVYDGDAREFSDHDVDFLESVATVIATAIERKQYERRLGETVEELESSNQRLEQFAYAASHDLQEPLRMVSSYLCLLESRYADDLDDDAEEFITYAVDGANRMRDMIDGLLEYSRVETQGEPFEPVDLEAVFEDVLTDLQVMIEGADAEIMTAELPTVRGDPRQLRQLFQNLLSNAIEYSGDEPPRIHVDAERQGLRWKLSVRDEGIGIEPEEADRIFRVFQRLHARDEYDGTGIGLALCRRIVERHDGEIWVESEPEEGSTFYMTLPRARTGR
ncbi:PAS domain S-box protein [Natronolimnohabitans innermongolicus]|uniref:histidine kinase n=1 Tax=Natronolimnohabitans innermongolicus JCM 12255 TaxID=1227499 RepID=L9WKI5_9EURY|nr:PAS domain S-box protein [Natronolimnohabitans innermongolicus]ELY48868.1 multi-sensor signal transduction histidine kinase [Natronolimnohabitans innermongolicus JCM 12255]